MTHRLYTLREIRLAARGNPSVRFRTQRDDGPIREVGILAAEAYFRDLPPKIAERMGRWFEVIPNDPPATD